MAKGRPYLYSWQNGVTNSIHSYCCNHANFLFSNCINSQSCRAESCTKIFLAEIRHIPHAVLKIDSLGTSKLVTAYNVLLSLEGRCKAVFHQKKMRHRLKQLVDSIRKAPHMCTCAKHVVWQCNPGTKVYDSGDLYDFRANYPTCHNVLYSCAELYHHSSQLKKGFHYILKTSQ